MIIGNLKQQNNIRSLLQKLISGSVILFGPEGIGKKSFIVNLAKDLAYRYILISSEKTYGIDLARSLKAVSVKSYQEKNLFIIDDAHKLTKQSQYALLKSIEEPNENVIFIMITSKIGSILNTIKSRSFLFSFFALSLDETKQILRKENVDLKKVKILLELYPGQPGKIMKYVKRKKFDKLLQFFLTPDKNKKLLLINDLTGHFSLAEILELQLMLLRRELLQFNSSKRNIVLSYEIFRLLTESESPYLSLNQNLQLTNLVLSQ